VACLDQDAEEMHMLVQLLRKEFGAQVRPAKWLLMHAWMVVSLQIAQSVIWAHTGHTWEPAASSIGSRTITMQLSLQPKSMTWHHTPKTCRAQRPYTFKASMGALMDPALPVLVVDVESHH